MIGYLYERTLKEMKNMDLNKILAENMLRFGVKNLSEISRLKLNEQAIATAVEYNLAQMPAILQSTNYKPDPLKYIAIPLRIINSFW